MIQAVGAIAKAPFSSLLHGSFVQIATYLVSNVSVKDCHLCLQQPPVELPGYPI